MLQDNIDARLTLATLLLEEAKEDEAILLLSPPKNLGSFYLIIVIPYFVFASMQKSILLTFFWLIFPESTVDPNSDEFQPWWLNGKVKLKLSHIYRSKGMSDEFVDAIFPLVRESLFVETLKQKVTVGHSISEIVCVCVCFKAVFRGVNVIEF